MFVTHHHVHEEISFILLSYLHILLPDLWYLVRKYGRDIQDP